MARRLPPRPLPQRRPLPLPPPAIAEPASPDGPPSRRARGAAARAPDAVWPASRAVDAPAAHAAQRARSSARPPGTRTRAAQRRKLVFPLRVFAAPATHDLFIFHSVGPHISSRIRESVVFQMLLLPTSALLFFFVFFCFVLFCFVGGVCVGGGGGGDGGRSPCRRIHGSPFFRAKRQGRRRPHSPVSIRMGSDGAGGIPRAARAQ